MSGGANFWQAQEKAASFSSNDVGSPVVPCPARPTFKTTRKSGGVTGQVLDVTYEVKATECTSLQAIQVVWAEGGPMTVGKMKTTLGGTRIYDAFVDGGKNSPYVTASGNLPADPTNPYYLTASEVASQVTYDPATHAGTVRIYDAPAAVNSWDRVFFETAVVCVNHKGSGKDKILKSFKWGWTGKGTKYQTDPGKGAKTSGLKEANSASPAFKKVVKNDYPGYSFY